MARAKNQPVVREGSVPEPAEGCLVTGHSLHQRLKPRHALGQAALCAARPGSHRANRHLQGPEVDGVSQYDCAGHPDRASTTAVPDMPILAIDTVRYTGRPSPW
jgi:hypothetical protein